MRRKEDMQTVHDIRIDRKKLHPWLDYKLSRLLSACGRQGIYLIITEGYRTAAYQNMLYARGRTMPGAIVTNARGDAYGSQHMWGIAFDIAINDSRLLYDPATIKKVAQIAKSSSVGLGWGGDWSGFRDTPHFYLKKWGSTTEKLIQKYGTPEVFQKTWRKTVIRDQGLLVYKRANKKSGTIKRVPKGKKVRVMYTKSWYAKVLLASGKAGYMNKKYLV